MESKNVMPGFRILGTARFRIHCQWNPEILEQHPGIP